MTDRNSKIGQWWKVSAAVFFIILAFFLASCFENKSDPILAEKTPSISPLPTAASIFAGIEGLECVPDMDHFEVATLIDVVDGDSIKVIVDGKQTQVRYIGVNTPEYDSRQRDAAIDATNENRRLLSGGTLYLFKDQSNMDKYDRLLRYVVANGRFINLALVQSGHAESKWYRPDISCQIVFDEAVP